MPYINAYIYIESRNMVLMNLSAGQEQRCRHRKQTLHTAGEGGGTKRVKTAKVLSTHTHSLHIPCRAQLGLHPETSGPREGRWKREGSVKVKGVECSRHCLHTTPKARMKPRATFFRNLRKQNKSLIKHIKVTTNYLKMPYREITKCQSSIIKVNFVPPIKETSSL